jgi:hypothetical protein
MSMETLLADLKANLAEVGKLSALSTVDDLVRHLKDVLWPTLEAIVEEAHEMDEILGDHITNADDILQPDTGAVLSAVVAGAVTVAQALRARIDPAAEPQLAKVIAELLKNCKEAETILEEIVLDEIEDEDDEDEDDEDEDDEDEDDEDEDDEDEDDEDEDDEDEDEQADAAEGDAP